MIDTVILMFKKGQFKITDFNKFKTNRDAIKNARGNFIKWPNNPTPQDKAKGIYKPRLTFIKRKKDGVHNDYEYLLKAEFSAPKMIFNDNLNEVDESNFEEVIKTSKSRLFDMGVATTEEDIKNSDISGLDISKNIPLAKGYTSTLAIRELSKIDLTKKLDLNKTDFRNGGQSLQYYANSHSLVWYDKVSDLNKPKGRAIDKNQTKKQLNLFESIKEKKEFFEVLKMEIRLRNKRKMGSILEKFGYPKNPKFQDIFHWDLCQKILKLYWHKMIIDENAFLFDLSNSPQNILKNILKHYPDIKFKKAVYLVGLNELCKDIGITTLGDIMASYRLKTAWGKLQGDIKALNEVSADIQRYGFVDDIERALGNYTPFRYNGSAQPI